MVSWMHIYLQTHQIVYFYYVQFLVCQEKFCQKWKKRNHLLAIISDNEKNFSIMVRIWGDKFYNALRLINTLLIPLVHPWVTFPSIPASHIWGNLGSGQPVNTSSCGEPTLPQPSFFQLKTTEWKAPGEMTNLSCLTFLKYFPWRGLGPNLKAFSLPLVLSRPPLRPGQISLR